MQQLVCFLYPLPVMMLAMLADDVTCDPTYAGTDNCSNSRASSRECANNGPTRSANGSPAQSCLLCSTHSITARYNKKNKNDKHNRIAFHLFSSFFVVVVRMFSS